MHSIVPKETVLSTLGIHDLSWHQFLSGSFSGSDRTELSDEIRNEGVFGAVGTDPKIRYETQIK